MGLGNSLRFVSQINFYRQKPPGETLKQKSWEKSPFGMPNRIWILGLQIWTLPLCTSHIHMVSSYFSSFSFCHWHKAINFPTTTLTSNFQVPFRRRRMWLECFLFHTLDCSLVPEEHTYWMLWGGSTSGGWDGVWVALNRVVINDLEGDKNGDFCG